MLKPKMALILRREKVLRDSFPSACLFNNISTGFATTLTTKKYEKKQKSTIEKKIPSQKTIEKQKKIPSLLSLLKSGLTTKSTKTSGPTKKPTKTKKSERTWTWDIGPGNLIDIVTFKRHTTLLLGNPRLPIKSGALRRNTGTQDQHTIEFLDLLSGLSGHSEGPLSSDDRDNVLTMGPSDKDCFDNAAFEKRNSLLFPQIIEEINLEFSPEFELVINDALEQLMVSHHLKIEKYATTCYREKSEFGLSAHVSVVNDIFVSEKKVRHSQMKHSLEIPYSKDVLKYKCADKLVLKQSAIPEKDKLESNVSSREISDTRTLYFSQPEDKCSSVQSEEYRLSEVEVEMIKAENQYFQTNYSQAPLSFKMISFFPLILKENLSKSNHSFELDAKTYFNYLPSVTGVIKKTMSERNKLILEKWKENMISVQGEKEFELYQQETLRNGVNLHANIREKLSGKPLKDIHIMSANKGHWDSFQPFLAEVQQVEALEQEVSHRHLMYRGFFDCLATYRNKLCVIDWKTSKKPKAKIHQTYDNPLQVAAYIGAWNSNPDNIKKNRDVTHGVIVVGYPDGSPADVHVMKPLDCQKYWSLWTKRLSSFYQTLYYEKVEHKTKEEEQSPLPSSAKSHIQENQDSKADLLMICNTKENQDLEANLPQAKEEQSLPSSAQSHLQDNQNSKANLIMICNINKNQDSEANLPHRKEEQSSSAQNHKYLTQNFEDSNLPQSFKVISGFPFFSSTLLDFEKSNIGFNQDFNKLFTKSPLVKDILDITWSEESKRKEHVREKGEQAIEEFFVDSLNQEVELHTAIQQLTYTPLEEINPPHIIENNWKSIQHVLSELSDFQGMKMSVVHNHLMYLADVNCIAQYRDQMSIIQWLPSNEPLPCLYDTGDAPLYMAAAMGALNSYPCHNHKFVLPTHGMVVVVYPDGSPAHVHTMYPEEFRDQWVKWACRLQTYFNIKHTKHTHHWR